MGNMGEACVDTIITDPPYGLNFMGQDWDHGVPGSTYWDAALRVAKPGAILLAFGGTRTWHRLASAIEDSGWEIRDTMMWLYGSGFPKSTNISRAVDDLVGGKREVIGMHNNPAGSANYKIHRAHKNVPITSAGSEEAAVWDGWGTGLKPSWEPIILAMKPRDGTYAQNALTWGVAGLNIDGARIATYDTYSYPNGPGGNSFSVGKAPDGSRAQPTQNNPLGRWPANVVLSHHPECQHVGTEIVGSGTARRLKRQRKGFKLSGSLDNKEYAQAPDNDGAEVVDKWDCHPDCPVAILGEQSGENNSRPVRPENIGKSGDGTSRGLFGNGSIVQSGYYDESTAARFFYQAKASHAERDEGCSHLYWQRDPAAPVGWVQVDHKTWIDLPKSKRARGNIHPTVKPVALLEYLCTLTSTPEGGVVFDPFGGSGSTFVAAVKAGRSFYGCDIEPAYVVIASARAEHELQRPRYDTDDLFDLV